MRMPLAFMALMFTALFNSFILSSIFGGVGGENIKKVGEHPYDKEDPFFVAHNSRIARNWLGVINFAATD